MTERICTRDRDAILADYAELIGWGEHPDNIARRLGVPIADLVLWLRSKQEVASRHKRKLA